MFGQHNNLTVGHTLEQMLTHKSSHIYLTHISVYIKVNTDSSEKNYINNKMKHI